MLTEIGPVEIGVPRDLDASFQPKIVKKRVLAADQEIGAPPEPWRHQL